MTARVAATYFSCKLICDGVELVPKQMILEMSNKFEIFMNPTHALRTRALAIEMVYGEPNESYQRLPSYLYLLRQRNLGTIYDLQPTRDSVFCHMFVALGQCIRSFVQLRPIIVIDGTHLKGRNHGILFVAIMKRW